MGERQAGSASFHADREQVEAVERYAKLRGARVEFMPPELSVSGGKPIRERPSLLAAIEGVEAGRYQGIVVAYLSRLTRSRSGLEIWDRVEAAGGSIHCAAEDIDTSTPNGRFVRDIHLANAVREREEHAAAHDRRRRDATERGIWQRRQTPRGYERGPDRRLVPSEDAELVRGVFRGRAQGEPVMELARRLGMTTSGVRALLRNRVYLGELRVGQYANDAAHEPLVTQAEWDAAQSERHARLPRSRETALLAGLVRCAGCGHRMSRGSGERPNYSCFGLHSGGRCEEPAHISVRRVDAYVERVVWSHAGGTRYQRSARAPDLTRLQAELVRAVEHRDAFYAAFGGGDIAAARAEAERRQRAVDDAQRALDRERASAGFGLSLTAEAYEAYKRASAAQRNAVLRRTLDAVIVRAAGGRGVVLPVKERVRVLPAGSGIVLPAKTAERPMGIHPIGWAELDGEHAVRVLFLQHGEDGGGELPLER